MRRSNKEKTIVAMMRKVAILSAVAALETAPIEAQAQEDCTHFRLLVSGWTSDAVATYDACDGSFVDNLDPSSNVAGPLARILHETLWDCA